MFFAGFLLSPHSDTLDTVGSSHYQPATDLLAHNECTYPQSHKSSIVFQLGQYIDGPLCKHLLDDQVILNANQKHLGCKKSARPIRSHNGYISDQKL